MLTSQYYASPPLKITINNEIPSSTKEASFDGKGGPLDGDDGTPLSRIDCSTSTYTNPKDSLTPKYRRQWLVVKDFPNKSDLTFSVVVLDLETKKLIGLYSLTKTDGTFVK